MRTKQSKLVLALPVVFDLDEPFEWCVFGVSSTTAPSGCQWRGGHDPYDIHDLNPSFDCVHYGRRFGRRKIEVSSMAK